MRATDDRYRGEQAKFDLAMRMIRHEARTGTIRYFTGLNDDRIRKLYTTYFKLGEVPVRRQRGRSPTRIGPLVRTPQRALESGVFAHLLLAQRLAVRRAAAGPAAQEQHRARPSVLRVLRDVRRARAAQRAVVRVGLEFTGQHAARRRARHRALRRVLDLLRVRHRCRCRARLARPACCSSSAATSSRSPRPGSIGGMCLIVVGARRRGALSAARRRESRRAARAADASRGVVAGRAARARRARSLGRRHLARGRRPRPIRGRDEHSRPRARARAALARLIGRGLSRAAANRPRATPRAPCATARTSARSTCCCSTATSCYFASNRAAAARLEHGVARVQQRATGHRVAEDGERARGRRAAARACRLPSSRCSRCSPSATTRARAELRYQRSHFVVGPIYGTRCSTVVLRRRDGRDDVRRAHVRRDRRTRRRGARELRARPSPSRDLPAAPRASAPIALISSTQTECAIGYDMPLDLVALRLERAPRGFAERRAATRCRPCRAP